MPNKTPAVNRIFTPSIWAKNPKIKKAQIAVAIFTIAFIGIILASFMFPAFIPCAFIAKVTLFGSSLFIGSMIFKKLKNYDNVINPNNLLIKKAKLKGIILSESDCDEENKIFQTNFAKAKKKFKEKLDEHGIAYADKLKTSLEETCHDPANSHQELIQTLTSEEHSTFNKSIIDQDGNKLIVPEKNEEESQTDYTERCNRFIARLFSSNPNLSLQAFRLIRICLMQKSFPMYTNLSSNYAKDLPESPENYIRRLDFSNKNMEISINKDGVHLKCSSICNGVLQRDPTHKIKLPGSFKVEMECDVDFAADHPNNLHITNYTTSLEEKFEEVALEKAVNTAYQSITKNRKDIANDIKAELAATKKGDQLITVIDNGTNKTQCCKRFYKDIDELPLFTIKEGEKTIKFDSREFTSKEEKQAYAASLVDTMKRELKLKDSDCQLLQVLLSQNAFRKFSERFSEKFFEYLPKELRGSHNLSDPQKSVIISIKREKSKIVFHLHSTLKYSGGGKMEQGALQENLIDPFKLVMNCDVSLDGKNVEVENIDFSRS